MSGSLAGNPLMTSVDTSIPLRAGQGAGQVNPLAQVGQFADTLGKINQTKLQQQQLQSGTLSLWQQQKQAAYAQIAPLVAQGRINSTSDLTTALAGIEAHGGVTAPFIQDMTDSLGQGGDFISNLKAQTVAGTQPPEKAVGALAPIPSTITQGLVNQPMLTVAPGMQGQGTRSPAGAPAQLGASPETQGQPVTWQDTSGATHNGTWAQYNEALGNGQVNGPARPITTPATAPGVSFGNPGGRFGPGTATQPGNPALRNPAAAQPGGAPANTPVPGARIMTDPNGKTWMVPPDKIAAATAAGYHCWLVPRRTTRWPRGPFPVYRRLIRPPSEQEDMILAQAPRIRSRQIAVNPHSIRSRTAWFHTQPPPREEGRRREISRR